MKEEKNNSLLFHIQINRLPCECDGQKSLPLESLNTIKRGTIDFELFSPHQMHTISLQHLYKSLTMNYLVELEMVNLKIISISFKWSKVDKFGQYSSGQN